MYLVYVVRNPAGKIYIGQTIDIIRRLDRHNGILPSKAQSFTKTNIGPWVLVYSEEYNTRKEALVREKYLKSHHGRDYIRHKLGR